jgi:ABC-2 type transport system ATP-binding protein
MFLSIHQIKDAARVCDRFVLLSGGSIRGEGTLDQLASLAAKRGAPATADLEEVFLALT